MAKDFTPPPPPTLKEALKEDRFEYDCIPCQILGSGAFIGLGVYTYISGHNQLTKREALIRKSGSRLGMGGRRVGITGMAATLVGIGIYRWFA
ncbi:hypothetical protein CC78DRAFT_622373 [Lojkania enalia]|uniref:Distal membrane-arm assembly complex protein 1-like domain-containing protein n=1 Tax=Lojkania enalia TaxID=147567 RepID=A0A9P4MXQ6_9PLEO|nr:hypothetical protein CC78DRAFT_622373 [Didymosphaeria enalia]